MPAAYAHYRFGAAMLSTMPGDISRSVKRYRRLYDVGLHGPDLFFFYNPLISTKAGKLGGKFHSQTGQEFFTRVCRSLRLEPSEAGQAYLYGVLCHYCLDSLCHPFVEDMSREGSVGHIQIESEFDRFLLEKDGKSPACQQDISHHMQLLPEECAVVARFYPGATPRQIQAGVKNMALVKKMLATKDGKSRDLLAKTIGIASKDYAAFVMKAEPDPACAHLDDGLFALYKNAEKAFPELLLQLGAHLTYNAPLGKDFTPTFG